MENRRSKLVLMVVAVVMLLVMAFSSVASGVAAPVVDPGDGIHNLLAPYSGGGSNST